jgi:hypothetical protein
MNLYRTTNDTIKTLLYITVCTHLTVFVFNNMISVCHDKFVHKRYF